MNTQVSQRNAGKGSIILNSSVCFHAFIFPTLLMAAVLFLMAGARNVAAGENPVDKSCVQCHNDMVVANMSKMYVHMPFLQQQCSVCHVAAGITAQEYKNSPPAPKKKISEKNIKWIDYTYSPSVESWFFIQSDKVSSADLVVSAFNERQQNYRKIYEMPEIETLPVKASDTEPPVIKSVGVRGVYSGVFISAQIGWTTDEKADSEVIYGIDELVYSEKNDKFTTKHKIVLQNLKADQKYQYVVVSKDIFGNSAVSETGSFTTGKFSPMPPKKYEQPRKGGITLNAQFFRIEDSYVIRLKANQPVTLKVGTVPAARPEKAGSGGMTVMASYTVIDGNPEHVPLRSIDSISSAVCRKCHAKMFGKGNHMINIGSSARIIIPAAYKTNSAGKITCVTCHNPHASNFEYITVKSRKGELCIGCHRGYNLPPERRPRQVPPTLMAQK